MSGAPRSFWDAIDDAKARIRTQVRYAAEAERLLRDDPTFFADRDDDLGDELADREERECKPQ